MLPITITLLLLCQHLSVTWSTRLPLEVYELTSSAATTAHDLHYLQQQQQQQQQQHPNLAYATVNAEQQHQQQQQQNATQTEAKALAAGTTLKHTDSIVAATANTAQQQLDRRRARQMLDLEQQQQQLQQQQHQHQQHRFEHATLAQLQLQQQQQHHHTHQQHAKNVKDVRILYQVGESEDDLPICAPNAVCSKIDLYETPWIERQCRCPNAAHQQPNIIIHHHSNNNKDTLEANSYQHIGSTHNTNNNNNPNSNNDKYRNYYDHEKLLQHKRLLVSGDFVGDKRFESLHLKKLMQKLGAVYEEDLDLQPSDFLETNEDGGHGAHHQPPLMDLDEELSENEFPHATTTRRKSQHQPQQPHTMSSAHMRHSGHGNHAKQLSYIGGCPSGLGIDDGHTIADKTRHYKMCNSVHKLPVCKHFRDYTWTLTTSAELNVTEQIVHCRCPKNSVTYLTKREPSLDGSGGFTYLFACSPLTRIRCQRKQPCKLFTVRKRQEFLDEVNINALCQCPKGHHCPSHHTQGGVIPGESFLEDNIQTYSGYCMVND